MTTERTRFFDSLKAELEHLKTSNEVDTEASRHDRLIYPFLTSPFTLGWTSRDILSQPTCLVPTELHHSHIFRGGLPRTRTPDLVISPPEVQRAIAVVEEKRGTMGTDVLNRYRLQLYEYQALFECTWGLLTDGEHWVLKRGFEDHHVFASLDELQKGIQDVQQCIGRDSILQRFALRGSTDLVIAPNPGSLDVGAFAQDVIAHLYDTNSATLAGLLAIASSRSYWSFKSSCEPIPWTHRIDVRRNEEFVSKLADLLSLFPAIEMLCRDDPSDIPAIYVACACEHDQHETCRLIFKIAETFEPATGADVTTGV